MVVASAAGIAAAAYAGTGAIPSDPRIESEIDKTMARMTLDEKIGQMTELAIDVLGYWKDGEFFLDEAKVAEAIGKYKVGRPSRHVGTVVRF